MRLYAMDAWVADAAALVDRARLRNALRDAARLGHVDVVGEAFHDFPNGGVTGVLVLAQSHLSIHTWPELRFANVDLLSYGSVDGHVVLETLAERIGCVRTKITVVERELG